MNIVRRYAANRVLTDRGLLSDAVVEMCNGEVIAFTELSTLNHETAATVFLNGTLTACGGDPIYIGYKGLLFINNTTLTEI